MPAVGVVAIAAWQLISPAEVKETVDSSKPAISIGGDGAISAGSGAAVVVNEQATVVVGLNEEKFASMLDARLTDLVPS